MTGAQFIALYRERAKDNASPPLCEDNEILLFLNEAEQEAAKRARLLFDRTTEALCSIDVTSGTATYTLNALVHEVYYASFTDTGGLSQRLRIKDREEMDRILPDWRDMSESPRFLIVDENSVELVGNPNIDGTIDLEVYRLPLVDIEEDTEPEIAKGHHIKLLDWILYKAFSSPDADLGAPARAMYHKQEFEKYFGLPTDADRNRSGWRNRPQRNKVW